MPVDSQLSVSKEPVTVVRTPSTGTPAAFPSRKMSLRTQSATATWRTPAPFGAAWTTTPPSVHACGTTQPSAGSALSDPAVSVTGKASSAIDDFPAPGLLADLAGQVQPLESELDGPGPLAVVAGVEPVADLVVAVGLAEDRQAHHEGAGRDLLTRGHHLAGPDPVDEQREVDAAKVTPD